MGAAQEIVLVGVGYTLDADRLRGLGQWGLWRTRDLTPVHRLEAEEAMSRLLSTLLPGSELPVQTGGAARFLQCLAEEVIPFVEAHYRVQPAQRGLGGYSFGGLFTLYTLFNAPDLFTRYFAGSPSMWDVVFEYEERYAAAHSDFAIQLFMTAGEHESDTCDRVARLVECLRSRTYPRLQLEAIIIPGEGHISGGAAAISRALGVLYYPHMQNR